MFGSIYTALAGMKAYSQGLDVISNNVANLNTPGFKVSDPVFREIVYRQIQSDQGGGLRSQGAGVEAGSVGVNFTQGELRDTGNPLDVAVDGSGFFILQQRDGAAYRYTRAGQFTFNDDGVLVERTTGDKVLVSTAENSSTSFDISSYRTHEPKATANVTISGVLARTGSTAPYELSNTTVYDKAGTAVSLRVRFTRNATDPLRWTAEVMSSANTVVGSGAVVFNSNGTPAEGGSSFTVPVTATGGEPFDVTFNFGATGTYSGATSPATSTTSSLQVQRQDGMPIGSLTDTAFDEQGQLKLSYSNGQSKIVGKLVIAQFDNPEQLRVLGGGMFALREGMSHRVGGAMADGAGRIMGKRVEMANVDLTRQFTDLIILQRGYQASSQVSSITNELIQTLLAMESGR